jgi:peptidoglycan/LPS O-acetylase OafA/YrhL
VVSQPSRHHNNCNLVRLIFAGLVVVSHSPVLADGNDLREPLLRLFGRMSFGDVSVDGFFLVSGYLITKSFARQPGVFGYLMKRVARYRISERNRSCSSEYRARSESMHSAVSE